MQVCHVDTKNKHGARTNILGHILATWKVIKLENLAMLAVRLLIFLAGTGLSVCY